MLVKRTCRVLIADSEPIFSHGLRRLLEDEDGFEVVAQTRDAAEAVRSCARTRPHVAFLDGALLSQEPRILAEIESEADCTRVVLWAPERETGALLGLVRLGAHGVLARTAPPDLVAKAARCVAGGQYWIGREAVADVVRWLRESLPVHRGTSPAAPSEARLTLRERAIIAAVAAGHSNKDIAAQLSVAEDTVKHHLSSVFSKLGMSSRLELAVYAMQHGLAERERPPDA